MNAALVDRTKMRSQVLVDFIANSVPWKYKTLADYGETKYADQAGFEVGLLNEVRNVNVPVQLATCHRNMCAATHFPSNDPACSTNDPILPLF